MVQLPWFQQVMRQGVSVQIMCSSLPPSSLGSGNWYSMNWSSVSAFCAPVPVNLSGPLRIASWISVLGRFWVAHASTLLWTGTRRCSLSVGLK